VRAAIRFSVCGYPLTLQLRVADKGSVPETYGEKTTTPPETAGWLQWVREGCYLRVLGLQAAVQKGIYWIDCSHVGRAVLDEHLAAVRSQRSGLGQVQSAE
jgi:hypothetical protein